jgi:CBS domain containing-hemolysin-like protein
MWNKRLVIIVLILLSSAIVAFLLAACDVDFREVGHKAGDLYSDAATKAVLDATAGAERAPTVASEIGERAPTIAAEVGERAPTVAAEAATAAQEFSQGVQESGACGSAAMIMAFGSLVLAAVLRRAG